MTARLSFVCACLLGGACESGSAGDGTWSAERTRRGDTTIVRTVEGSVWGPDVRLVEELRVGVLDGDENYIFGRILNVTPDRSGNVYVLERSPALLRMYDAQGRFVRTIAREGQGPGELFEAVRVETLADGRIVVWNRGNQRVSAYFAADGALLDEWPVRSNFFSAQPLSVDSADNLYIQILTGEPVDGKPWPLGQLVVSSSGEVLDTLVEPQWDPDGGLLAPTGHVAVHPGGYFVAGWAGQYSFDVLRDPPLRVEKDWTPVALTGAEREEWDALIRRRREQGLVLLSRAGPVDMTIPDTKPAYRGLYVGRDGRIWVHLYVDVEEQEVDPGSNERRWQEPIVFDVFEDDGRYLGRIRMPNGASAHAWDGDYVWGVQRGESDEPYIVRWRIERSPLEGS